MKIIKQIGEGELWTSTFIGYKITKWYNLDNSETNGLRLGLNFYFFLIKIDIFPVHRHD